MRLQLRRRWRECFSPGVTSNLSSSPPLLPDVGRFTWLSHKADDDITDCVVAEAARVRRRAVLDSRPLAASDVGQRSVSGVGVVG